MNYPKIVTPYVECEWAHIKTPCYTHDSNGIYEMDLLFDTKNTEHMKFLNEQVKPHVPKDSKKPVLRKHKSREGILVMKCKQKKVVQAKGKVYNFDVKVFDASRNPLVGDAVPLIGNGSKVSVFIELRPYTMNGGGLSCKPLMVQIINLVEYNDPKTEGPSNPFGAVDNGFVSDNVFPETHQDDTPDYIEPEYVQHQEQQEQYSNAPQDFQEVQEHQAPQEDVMLF